MTEQIISEIVSADTEARIFWENGDISKSVERLTTKIYVKFPELALPEWYVKIVISDTFENWEKSER